MGPAKVTWVQYCYSPKCVGFEPIDKVGPVNLIQLDIVRQNIFEIKKFVDSCSFEMLK